KIKKGKTKNRAKLRLRATNTKHSLFPSQFRLLLLSSAVGDIISAVRESLSLIQSNKFPNFSAAVEELCLQNFQMAARKLVRDLLLARQPVLQQFKSPQGLSTTSRLLVDNRWSSYRRFGVFNNVKEEANRNPELKKSVKELKEKAEELKGVKEDLKVRTKQTAEKLYKHVDGVWSEAEATAKKVSSSVKEKISAATEEVKGTFKMGKQESSEPTGTSSKGGPDSKENTNSAGEETNQSSQTKIPSLKVSSAFQRFKDAKVTEIMKKGYDIVKDELTGNSNSRKHLEYTPFKGDISTKTEVVPISNPKQSRLSEKWEAFRKKMQGNPVFKRFSGISQPVVTKGQEIAEDMRERWETSDNPIVHKIQDAGDTIFQETDTASSIKEIRRRDPSFSLPDFVAEVQDAIRPVLHAYMKGDTETLKKYCSPEVISRCEGEHKAFKSHGMFFDNRLLHVSEVEVRETKMMGTSPIIIVAFQTQQIHCVRDSAGKITEGGQDTIHTVYYAWAMQQVEPQELGEGAIYPIWRLREMQQIGVQALI
ncbi:Mitochondrial import inner membrane translocase subunit TIM44-2, partial [Linum perenne]